MEYKELYDQMMKMNHLMERYTHQQMEHSPFAGRRSGQGRVIRLLQIQPEMTAKDLSYLLDIRQQSLNELLNRLEKNGYVERHPSEEDRRVMIVHLTEAGKAIPQPQPDGKELFDSFSDEELEQFAASVAKVTAVLEEKTGSMSEEERMHWMHHAEDRMGHEQFERVMMHSRFPRVPFPPHPEHMPHPGHPAGPRPEDMPMPCHPAGPRPEDMPMPMFEPPMPFDRMPRPMMPPHHPFPEDFPPEPPFLPQPCTDDEEE